MPNDENQEVLNRFRGLIDLREDIKSQLQQGLGNKAKLEGLLQETEAEIEKIMPSPPKTPPMEKTKEEANLDKLIKLKNKEEKLKTNIKKLQEALDNPKHKGKEVSVSLALSQQNKMLKETQQAIGNLENYFKKKNKDIKKPTKGIKR